MLKSEFRNQMVSKFDLGLLNAYKLICFDRNIDGKTIIESCVTPWWQVAPHCTWIDKKLIFLSTSYKIHILALAAIWTEGQTYLLRLSHLQ